MTSKQGRQLASKKISSILNLIKTNAIPIVIIKTYRILILTKIPREGIHRKGAAIITKIMTNSRALITALAASSSVIIPVFLKTKQLKIKHVLANKQ
jgi:hypothetical protein